MEPFTPRTPSALSWKPGAIVSVAPAFTVRSRHAAFATPDVDGLFGVPEAMIASTPRDRERRSSSFRQRSSSS